MRVALGPSDPAGVGSALAGGLQGRGHEAEVVTLSTARGDTRSDRVVGSRDRRSPVRVRRALLASTSMHVMGGRSWLFYADLLAARARGRLALIQYNGSDCRTSDIARRAALRHGPGPSIPPATARSASTAAWRPGRRGQRWCRTSSWSTTCGTTFSRIYVAPFAIDMPAIERATRGVRAQRRRAAARGSRPLASRDQGNGR